MPEDNNNTNNPIPDNSINPDNLFNSPDNSQPVSEPTTTPTEEPVTLTPEPATEAAPEPGVPNPGVDAGGEVGPIQTDLNQVPPTPPTDPVPEMQQTAAPQTSPFPSQDVTNVGFTEKAAKGKGGKKLLVVIVALIIIALLGYFVIYPIIANKFMSSPKNVFEATIDKITTNVNTKLEQVNLGSSLYEIETKFDTNIEDLKPFANYNIKLKGGMDSKNKLIEGSASMTGTDNKEIGATVYVKNDYLFYKLSSDERIVKAMDLSQDEDYKMLFSKNETITSADIQYLIDKSKEAFIKELKEEDFTKEENFALTINGSEIKTTKNTLEINKEKFTTYYKAVINALYNDSKAMDIINKMGMSKEDFKDEFVDVDYDDIDNDFKVIINVYSVKTDVVGFDLYSKEEKEVYFYSNDGNFESALLPGEEDSEVSFVGIKDGDSTNATLKVAGTEVAKFKFYTMEENNIKFDYTLNPGEDSKVSGTIAIKTNNNVTDIEFSAKAGDEYIKGTTKVKIEENAKIANFDDSKAVTLNEEEQNKMLNDFLEKSKGSPLDLLTENLGGMDYNNYDYYSDYNSITPSEYNDVSSNEYQPVNAF